MPLPSRRPLLRLAIPGGATRADHAEILCLLARLLASGTAMSKADLGRATGLARTTVSSGVEELIGRGMVVVAGRHATFGRGRPADRLMISGAAGVVLLADLGARHAELAVYDLAQRELARVSSRLDISHGPEVVLAQVVKQLRELLAGVPAPAQRINALVAGLPGPVDSRQGVPVRPPIMPGWDAYPVARMLGEEFGCPVVLENDVNLRALGEARALPPDQAPLLFVKVGTGIGGGLVTVDGHLHHGADGAAGDIGHIPVSWPHEVRCACGKFGCVEAVASTAAVLREVEARLPERRSAPLELDDLERLLRRADTVALEQVRIAAAAIGEVVATLVHVLNPALVVIGGSVPAAMDEMLAGIRAVVYHRALPLATRNLVLTRSILGAEAGLAGALVLAVESTLSPQSLAPS
jgi:predicted NBD/HSP70 family sugar kinase